MKSFIFIPFAILLGLLIGSWSPRSEITKLKAELKTTRQLLKQQPRRARAINEVTSFLGIEKSSGKTTTKSQDNAAVDSAESSEVEDAEPVSTNPEMVVPSVDVPATEENTEPAVGMADGIDRAVELWRVRVDIARSTFIRNTRLTDVQELNFNNLVDNMNLRIGESIDGFADNIRDAEEVQMEAGVRIMNEITDSIVQTYDEMDKTMPEDWRRGAGKSFTLVDFIDPEVGRPLVGVEDKLEGMNNRSR